jgi:glc operon protein GlcG
MKSLARLIVIGVTALAPMAYAQPPGPVLVENISLEQATALIQASIEYAKQHNVSLSVVVVDTAGHIVTGARMNGVPFASFDVARGKALACVATGGTPGRELMDRYKANPIVFGQISSLSYGGPMFPSQGSLPIYFKGTLIGAVGASAASSQIDEDAGRAGIKAIGASETK